MIKLVDKMVSITPAFAFPGHFSWYKFYGWVDLGTQVNVIFFNSPINPRPILNPRPGHLSWALVLHHVWKCVNANCPCSTLVEYTSNMFLQSACSTYSSVYWSASVCTGSCGSTLLASWLVSLLIMLGSLKQGFERSGLHSHIRYQVPGILLGSKIDV